MDYIALVIGIASLIITIIGVYSNRKIKKMIIIEKDLIKDKVSDIRTNLQGHVKEINNDRRDYNDPARSVVHIRIEELESLSEILERLVERLNTIK